MSNPVTIGQVRRRIGTNRWFVIYQMEYEDNWREQFVCIMCMRTKKTDTYMKSYLETKTTTKSIGVSNDKNT